MSKTIAGTWTTCRGQGESVLTTKDGQTGTLQTSYPTEKWNKAVFSVRSPEAIAEFQARVNQLKQDDGEGDYDGEATFADWLQYIFQKRNDVQYML